MIYETKSLSAHLLSTPVNDVPSVPNSVTSSISSAGRNRGKRAKAIAILGMHRSGTSAITRAVNLLGFYLGDETKLMGRGADNPEKFWEHLGICRLQERLLAQLHRSWDTASPLPEQWHLSETFHQFRNELRDLVAADFSAHSFWAWKDPRSCLLMPLWRDILEELQTDLHCIFVVRNPIDVANSLNRRDPISFNKAMGVWFNYCVTALKDTAAVPTAFVSYDRFVASCETEMRRCLDILNLQLEYGQLWQENIISSICPELRHNCSSPDELNNAPRPVQDFYYVLAEACLQWSARDGHFDKLVGEFCRDFHAYASFFEAEQSHPARLPFVSRTLRRWKKSFRKRLSF